MAAVETLVDGLDDPEGVAYDRRSGALWAGGEDGQLYRVDRETRALQEVLRVRGEVLGVAVDGRGRVVVAEDPQGTLLAAPTNVCSVGRERDRVVAANLNRTHLTILDLDPRGAPLHAPERWAVDAL